MNIQTINPYSYPFHIESYKDLNDKSSIMNYVELEPRNKLTNKKVNCAEKGKDQFVTREFEIYFNDKVNKKKKVFTQINRIDLSKTTNCQNIKYEMGRKYIVNKNGYDYKHMKYVCDKNNLSVTNDCIGTVILIAVLMYLMILGKKMFSK